MIVVACRRCGEPFIVAVAKTPGQWWKCPHTASTSPIKEPNRPNHLMTRRMGLKAVELAEPPPTDALCVVCGKPIPRCDGVISVGRDDRRSWVYGPVCGLQVAHDPLMELQALDVVRGLQINRERGSYSGRSALAASG
ncbi:MAG: hypothetical protein ACJ789_12950 [Thermomicrobiales bacterium]